MDVIQAWQAGYRNVVAQMGTALTGDQLRLLKRHTKRFVLALDADAAGASATLRSLSVARETLDRTAEVRFDARGLVHHEGRLQADIRIVTLPAGEDPDSLIRRDPAAWPALLEGAQPVVAYVIEMAAGQLDPADAKAKTAIARQVLPLIGDIADAVERDHYLQLLGRRLAVDERALRRLWAEMTARPSTGSGRRRSPPARTAHQAIGFPPDRSANGGSVDSTSMPPQRPSGMVALATQMRQANYLRQVLEHRHLLELVDRRLQGVGQPAVNIKEFDSVEDRALLSHLREQIEGGTMGDVEELSAALDPTLRQHVRYLLQLPATPEGELQRLPDTLAMSILDWRLEKVKALLREVSALFRDAREHDQSELLDMHKQQLRALPALLSQIDMAKFSLSSQSRRDG